MFPRHLVRKWLVSGGLQLLSGVKFVWCWRGLPASVQRKCEARSTLDKLSLLASYSVNAEEEYLGNQGLLMCQRWEDYVVFPCGVESSNIDG